MSFSHHGQQDDAMRREHDKQLMDAMNRFQDQVNERAKREYTRGRLGAEDDGSLAFAIGHDPKKKVVVIDFGKPVVWVAMPPEQCVELINSLKSHVQALGHPVTIEV